jgi:hypothetical protein
MVPSRVTMLVAVLLSILGLLALVAVILRK